MLEFTRCFDNQVSKDDTIGEFYDENLLEENTMKQFMSLTLIITCLCILACGDRTNVDILTNIAPHIEQNIVTDLTPEVWELLKKFRTGNLTGLEKFKHIFNEEWWTEQHEKETAYAEGLKVKQEAFYNRYIDADGLAIVGNDATPDKYFVAAKNVYLLMTSKRPELRDRLRGNTYLTVVDHLPIHFVPEISIRSSEPVFFSGTIFSRTWHAPHPSKSAAIINFAVAKVFHGMGTNELMRTVVHELAHVLENQIPYFDPDFLEPAAQKSGKLYEAYKNAKEKELWGIWLSSNHAEYWADLTEIWFYEIGNDSPYDFFQSYEELEARDPMGYALLDEWFPKISLYGIEGLIE